MTEPDELGRSARLAHERRDRRLREGERPMALNLALIGALGWLIVAPTLGGIFIGRWIDRGLDTGIMWTAALMMVGLAIGCRLAWIRIHRE